MARNRALSISEASSRAKDSKNPQLQNFLFRATVDCSIVADDATIRETYVLASREGERKRESSEMTLQLWGMMVQLAIQSSHIKR